jgi:hypothetical protein
MPESSFTIDAIIRQVGVVHEYVSPKADDPDTELVRPSNWNDRHVFVGSHVIARSYVVSGSPHTWSKPTDPGFLGVRRRVWGSGGAGGGAASTGANQSSEGAGGGSGGYAEHLWLNAQDCPSTMTVTVGAGGTPGTAGNNAGNNGNTTSITGTGLTTLSANGGGGGGGMAAVTAGISVGGAAGGASGGDLSLEGSEGKNGRAYAANQPSSHGDGGAAPFGGSQRISGTGTGSAGLAGPIPGGGGSGGINFQNQGAARQGGTGGDGLAIIEEFYL